jgi:hypothetical protein
VEGQILRIVRATVGRDCVRWERAETKTKASVDVAAGIKGGATNRIVETEGTEITGSVAGSQHDAETDSSTLAQQSSMVIAMASGQGQNGITTLTNVIAKRNRVTGRRDLRIGGSVTWVAF